MIFVVKFYKKILKEIWIISIDFSNKNKRIPDRHNDFLYHAEFHQ